MIYQFTSPSQVGPVGASMGRIPSQTSNPLQAWSSIAQLNKIAMGLRTGIAFNRGLLSAYKQQGFLCLDRPHPFKIYNVPSVCVAVPNDSTDWLRYRVRSGMVDVLDVDGTDEVDDPDSDEVPTDGTGDITVDSGNDQYMFWIELSNDGSNHATIKSGDPNSNGWTDYPTNDGRFILIGWVDTTDTTNKIGKVRQIQRTDVNIGIDTTDCSSGGDSPVDYQGYRFTVPS